MRPQTLSVQVHPDDARAARLNPPDLGKTEAWFVLEAEPGQRRLRGPETGRRPRSARGGDSPRTLSGLPARLPAIAGRLHLPAGRNGPRTWRRGAGGGDPAVQRRHLPAVRLESFGAGRKAAAPARRTGARWRRLPAGTGGSPTADITERPQVTRLVQCQWFIWDRVDFASPLSAGGDGRCHVITVVEGTVHVEGDPSGVPLVRRGQRHYLQPI